jgi:hypothetical protein
LLRDKTKIGAGKKITVMLGPPAGDKPGWKRNVKSKENLKV